MWFLSVLAGFAFAQAAFALKTAIKTRMKPGSINTEKELLETPPAMLRFSLSFLAVMWSFFFIAGQEVVHIISMTATAYILTALFLTIAITGITKAGTPRIAHVSVFESVISRIFIFLSAVYSFAFLYFAATGR